MVFHEVFALLLLEVVSFAAVLSAAVDYRRLWAPLFAATVAQMLHQWAWLVVTCLRCTCGTSGVQTENGWEPPCCLYCRVTFVW